jgi:hypothetical protein
VRAIALAVKALGDGCWAQMDLESICLSIQENPMSAVDIQIKLRHSLVPEDRLLTPRSQHIYSHSQKVVTLDFLGHILFEFVSRERLSQMKNKSNNKKQLDFDPQ